MKKMTLLTVILVLALALTACGSEKAPETTAAATTEAATVPVETTEPQPLTLTDWSMSASTWSSPNGATIHITATPSTYAENQKADFVVRLEGDEITSVPCEWDGTVYTASADLNAANGYCYYVVLTAGDGSSTEVAVNIPSEPVNTSFIDLEAALESYCSITLEESSFDGGKLSLTTGKAQVKVPSLANNGERISCQEAVLVLSRDGQELQKQALTLTGTDAAEVYECDLSSIVFEIPEMEEQQKVELTLTAALTNGQTLSAYGGSWICSGDTLLPAVG